MAKQLNVSLAFSANTTQAKQSILDLQKTLQQIATQPININDKSLQQSVEAAKQLTYHLSAAFNTTTGKLDLTAFNTSLKRSSNNVTTLSANLLQAGQIGQQAFIQLAQAIAQAEYPMLRVNKHLTEMWTTMKNTARWQLSSSVLHGFIGAIQKAYGYAQDLNESLNNIRIVTGHSVEDMALFAEEANKAAKALHATTTEYTNASLIYYQQGLSDQQVKERTDITIKMANVSRQSAEIASDQMTAIWNNFYDGSQSLEHYADVMTALGAATASSTDEIAGGLEKFAAIADTIGLSYEYAASALATITSNTRQSEEVVGTALKTIFARIQGLNLGETLEDGTTLNKYSEALEKVGISIFDSAGELKKMDTILDEMGNKWQYLAKDQQIALAQTVAGVRQYNQLISLMDNWDSGDEDSMQANLKTSYGANGALQEQADTYAEGWEAASKKVRTSLEGIYQTLLDDKIFIKFNNDLADILSGVEHFIESIGGVKGVISSIGTFLLSMLADKIEPAIRNTIQNITVLFTGARGQVQKFIQDMSQINEQQITSGNYNIAQQQLLINAQQLTAARQQLSIASKNMSEQEARMAEFTLQGLTVQQDQAQAIAESIVQLENQRTTLLETAAAVDLNTEAQRTYASTLRILTSEQSAARAAYMQDDGADIDNKINAYHRAREATEFYQNAQAELKYTLEMSTNAILDNYRAIDNQEDKMSDISSKAIAPFATQIADLSKQLQSNTTAFGSETETLMLYADALLLIQRSMPSLISQNDKVKKAFNAAFDARKPQDFIKILNTIVSELNNTKFSANQLKLILKSLDGKKFLDLEQNIDALSKKQKELLNIQKQLNAAFAQFNPTHVVNGIERLAASAAALGQISMIITSLRSAFDALNEETDMTFGERITTILMSFSMLVPAVIGSFKNLGKAIQGTTLETWLYTRAMQKEKFTQEEIIAITTLKAALQKGEAGQATALAAIKTLVITALDKEGIALNRAAKAEFEKIVADELAQGSDLKTAITKALVTLTTNKNKQAVNAETAAKVANKVATDALNVSLKSLLGPIGLIIAAIGVIIGLFTAWSEKQKQMAETRAEDAEASREQIRTLKEETRAVKDLYDAYLSAAGALDGSQSSKDALRSATEELCKALGVEWDALDKLQGKYEDVNAEIIKTQLLALENAALEAQKSANYNRAALQDAGFAFGSTNDYNILEVKEGLSWNDENDVLDLFNTWSKQQGYFNETFYMAESIHSLVSMDETALRIADFYDYLINEQKTISKQDLDQSEFVAQLRKFAKGIEDEKAGIQESEDYLNELIPQIAEKRAQLSLPGLLEDIETEEDYEKYRTQYVQTLEAAYKEFGKEVPSDLETIANNYFAQYDFLKPVVETSQYLVGIKERLKANGETDAAIKEFITHLKENNLVKVVAQVITDNSTIDSLNSSMDAIQKLADSKQLIIRWNILPTAKSDLKDNMTTEEYQTWLNKYSKDLFGEGGILGMSAETFSSLSYTQQQNALTNAYDYTNMDQVYDNAIASQQTLLHNEKNNVPKLKQISVSQAAENKGIHNIDPDLLWAFKQLGDLDYNSEDIFTQQADILNDLAAKKGLTQEEMAQWLQPIAEQYGSILSISKTISDEYNTQNELLKNEYAEAMSIYNTTIQAYEKNIADLQAEQKLVAQSQLTNRFKSASSLGDIYAARDFGIDNEVDINYDVYAEALMRVATAYNSCADEMDRYHRILRESKEENSNITEDQIAQAQTELEVAIAAGEMAEAYNLNADAIERYADELQSSGKYSKANQKALIGMAKDQLRFDRAVNTASSNMEDWIEDLNVAKKTGHLVSETAEEMASAYGDLLDIDGSDLSADFLKNQTNFENLKKALKGDEAAYKALQEAARKDIAVNIGINDEEFQTKFNNLMEQCQIGSLPDLEVGASLDNQDFLNGLSEMITAAGMTAEQATNYLSAMGIDAEVITEPETVKEVQGYNLVATPGTETIQYNPGADAGGVATATYPTVTYTPEPVYTEKTVIGTALKVTSASKSSGGKIKKVGSTTANGGSNSTAPKDTSPPKQQKRSEVGERYKENNDLLAKNSRIMDEASAAAERLWGSDRLAEMEKINNALEEEIDLLAQRTNEAKKYVAEDKSALLASAGKLKTGIALEFNEDGNITNYTEFMDAAYENYKTYFNAVKKNPNSESAKKRLEDYEEWLSDFESDRKQYDDSNNEVKESEKKRRDAIREWQDNNFENITYKLEFKIEGNEDDLKLISHYLDKATSSIYDYTEAMALYQKQYEQYADNMSHYENYLSEIFDAYYGTDAKTAYLSAVETGTTEDFFQNQLNEYADAKDRGEISTEKFREGLSKLQDGIIDTTKSLEEQKQALQDYYSNVVSMAIEEIGLYTAEMEQLNSVLDHYSNIMDLVGKQEDRVTKNQILTSKANNLQKEYQTQSKIYEDAAVAAQKWQDLLVDEQQKGANADTNAIETYKKNWQAAQQAANDAQDQMLTKTQEWAEAMKAIIENELAEIADTMEQSLTGGTSFDELMISMERRSSLQEEYLTTTNKIYETNKLMRQAQQEIDKTSNTVAKRRLQSFISETNQMQNQNKLSQYELDIQQAKYDLLLAEIALEEAQNAKSTVRLQRDAEGNFGYVYTADSNAVADAEQKMADAQNKLYNIGLEGANNYAQKYAETLQESQDAITELTTMWMNGEIETEEEFNRRKLEITQYYGEKLQQYSSLQTTALSVDSRIAGEAWSSEFMNITTSVAGWRQSVDLYFGSAAEQMNAWKDASAQALEQSKLNDLNTALGEVNTKSATLYGILMGDGENQGVVDAMSGYVSAAETASKNSITLQGDIDTLTASYGRLLEQVVAVNKNIKTVESPKFNEPDDDDGGGEETLARDRVYGLYSDIWHGKYGNGWTSRKTAILAAGYTEAEFDAAKALVNGLRKWKKESKFTDQDWSIAGLATGGYTGDWEGAYGKLAFLHQKELVLNAGDTENFLASMEVLERILRVIDLHSANSQIGGLLSSPAYRGHNNESVIQQDVRIEASFPGVTDRNEIEEAFNNLVNQASQYANRK